MNINGFVQKWLTSKVTVFVDVNTKEFQGGKIEQLLGREGWDKIYTFFPPNWPQFAEHRDIFENWLRNENSAYRAIINEEKQNNKLEFLKKHGLTDYNFCAFQDSNMSTGVLVDGSHRFINLNYLKNTESIPIKKDIDKIVLDILTVSNLKKVLPEDS